MWRQESDEKTLDGLKCTVSLETDYDSCSLSCWVCSFPVPCPSLHAGLGEGPALAAPSYVRSPATCFLGRKPQHFQTLTYLSPRIIPALDFNSDLLCCCLAPSQHNLEIYIILMNSFMRRVNCLFW